MLGGASRVARPDCYLPDPHCRQNHRGRALNAIQRCGERGTVAVVQVQVVNRGLCDLEADGFADDEGHGLRFEFARVT